MTIDKTKTTTEPRDNPEGYQEDATASATAPPMPLTRDGNHGRIVFFESTVPSHLGARGRRAFELAAAHASEVPDGQRLLELIVQYANAVNVFDRLESQWLSEGCPTTMERGTGATAEHPLMASMAKWDARITALAGVLGMTAKEKSSGKPGRPQGSNDAPDRKKYGPRTV